MNKRGNVIAWQQSHWAAAKTAYQGGGGNPDIPPGGGGGFTPIPEFTTTQSGTGTHREVIGDKEYTWIGERSYVTPPLQYLDGRYYRFVVTYKKTSRTNDSCMWALSYVWCGNDGRLDVAGVNKYSNWDENVCERHGIANACIVGWGDSDFKFSELGSTSPQMSTDFFNMVQYSANDFIRKCEENATIGMARWTMISFNRVAMLWEGGEPFTVESQETIDSDIVARAMMLKDYKYWYGGDGRAGTVEMANSLRKSYPSIWTSSYYNKALKDVGQPVGDCSYLCNFAYGIASPGRHGPSTSQYKGIYTQWPGAPKNGMILWRSAHCAIYNNGTSIELVGIDYDFQVKTYEPSKWKLVYYDKNRRY